MENCPDAVERDAHARSAALRDFRPVEQQHCLDIRPGNVGALLEDRFQHALVLIRFIIVSKTDIDETGNLSPLS
jgi:hypothetical protein